MTQAGDRAPIPLDILDVIEDGVFVFSPESLRFSYVNQGACQQTGYVREELLGMTPLDLKLEYDEPSFRELLAPLLCGEKHAVRFATTHRHKNGRDIPVEVILQHLTPSDAAPRLVAIVRDITERKKAERTLQEQKDFLNTILESEPECVKVISRDGELLQMNQAGLSMLECNSLEDAEQTGLLNFVHPDDRSAFLGLSKHVFEGGTGTLEFRVVGKKGALRWLETHASPLHKADGTIYALVGVTRDITQRKIAEHALQREVSEWNQAMDTFDDVIYLLDAERRLVRANKMFYVLAQTTPEEAIGKHIVQLIHPLGELTPCPVCRAQEEKRDSVITLEADHPDNPTGRPLEITVKMIHDQQGTVTGILMALHDLNNARQMEQQLRESEEMLKRAQSVAHVGSWKVDLSTHAITWSDEAYRILDYPLGQPVSMDVCFERVLPEDREFVANAWQQALKGTPYNIEYRINTLQGTRWVRDRAELSFDDQGKAIMAVGTIQDISEAKANEKQIEFLAFHDPLTGLPNRLLAKDHLEMAAAYASRSHTKVALLFLDLDNFKTINDSLGHAVGDALLQEVTARLRDCVRNTDTISRQGGDEFLVLLPDSQDTDAITAITEKILRTLSASFNISGYQLTTSASIGIAVYPDDGSDFETLLKKADTAMYQSKKAGRSTYRFYTEQMNIDAVAHHEVLNGLVQALERQEFVLHYQPQFDLASGAVIGAEALIRWQHPQRGMVPPGQFIPVAEDSGHIVAIGEWVLGEACRQAVAWQQAGLPGITIAVNLSAVQFKRSNLETSVTHALAEAGLRPELLELELTESILIQDTENVLATVRRLKALGVKLSIDDFGTGYSSLSYLNRFAVDKLKIDQSFVRNMVNDPGNAAIVRAIIQMAKSLNLKTIAEGVEDEHMLAPLRLHHCDEAQGYHFARPMPADEFARHLAQTLK